MNTKKILLPFALVIVSNIFAQKTILWKVTKENAPHVSYLLGTNHLMRNSFVESYPVISETIEATDILFTEADLNKDSVAAYFKLLPSDDSAYLFLSETEKGFLDSMYSVKNINYNKLLPAELFFYLSSAAMSVNGDFKKNETDTCFFEACLKRKASAAGKQIKYLETIPFQMQTIKEYSKKYNTKNLESNLRSVIKRVQEKEQSKLINLILNRSYDRYASMSTKYKLNKSCPENKRELVTDRNNNWMKQLPDMFSESNCLVAVGLGHLQYNTGLIMQLRQQGYTVEPVSMK